MRKLIKRQSLICLLLLGLIVKGHAQSLNQKIDKVMEQFVALNHY